MILGQDEAVAQFLTGWRSGRVHHAWLLAGPRGVGKAHFARLAATRVLAETGGPTIEEHGLTVPDDHRIARLLAAGSHPDFRWLERLERPSGGLARNISVDQIRALSELFAVTPSMGPWRVIVIDSVDDLETSAANALLKMLEEPPANTLFFLVSHAPGRLLPTVRSRCRRLDFQKLSPDVMTSLLSHEFPDKTAAARDEISALADGSIGRALAIAQLDLATLEQQALRLMREGDPTNAGRAKLATSLSGKSEADRYAAFLNLLPGMVAGEAIKLEGDARGRALDAYGQVRQIVAIAPRLSLDPAATVFQLGGILASVALKR